MTYILTTRSQSGTRYYQAGAGELAVQERNAEKFQNRKEAEEARSKLRTPFADMFGSRLRGFAIEAYA